MIIAIDIDGVICEDYHEDFRKSYPFPKSVDIIRNLRKEGHYILIYSARGKRLADPTVRSDTIKQLSEWNVLYDEICWNKPFYDLVVDDKAFSSLISLEKAFEKIKGV